MFKFDCQGLQFRDEQERLTLASASSPRQRPGPEASLI